MLVLFVGCVLGRTPDPAQTPANGIRLTPVARGLKQVTDIQFHGDRMLVATQTGRLAWVDAKGEVHTWRDIPVVAGSERGLLGIAIHPKYAENGQIVLSWTEPSDTASARSKIGVWTTGPGSPLGSAPLEPGPVLFEIDQPWSNHNGGGVQFGPDGMLYVGFGDGGKANDPLRAGQDPSTALGAMIRLDPDAPAPHIPRDNPWFGTAGAEPALWAIGLRNPWRFSFTPDGRLLAADVGQNAWEELTWVARGANLGWNVKEGLACFASTPCDGPFVDPFWVMPRDQGTSITGGYVAGDGPLAGRYVFGDFGSGRIWSLALPDGAAKATDVIEHGRFEANWSTFGRDGSGRVYVGDYASGVIFRIDPP